MGGHLSSLRQRTTLLTKLIQRCTVGDLQPIARPDAIKTINHWPDHWPAGWCIQPAETDQAIGLAKRRDISQHCSVGLNGMNPCHCLAIANAGPILWGIVLCINVNKADGLIAILATQKRHLAPC